MGKSYPIMVKKMNKLNKKYICIVLSVLVIYTSSIFIFGKKNKTVVDNPYSSILKEKPRLQDDYYDFINYDQLSIDHLGEDKESWFSLIDAYNQIKIEKQTIIDEILDKCDEYKNDNNKIKVCNFYSSYKNKKDEAFSKAELNLYIKKINDSQNIEDFIKNVLEVDKSLSLGILINQTLNSKPSDIKKFYYTLDIIGIDANGYTLRDYYDSYTWLLDINREYYNKFLIEYGYNEDETSKKVSNTMKFYEDISTFSLKSSKINDKGYKLFTKSELNKNLNHIDINQITKIYEEYYNDNDYIMVGDYNQLKSIDNYLQEENLQKLKDYAITNIIVEYSPYLSDNLYKIYKNYKMALYGEYFQEFSDDEIMYNEIYEFFPNIILQEFIARNFSEREINFYVNLIKEEINTFKIRIQNIDWLSLQTKEKAITKLDNMTYNVAYSNFNGMVEDIYKISNEESYLQSIIDIKKANREELLKHLATGDYTYGFIDYLDLNAYYHPSTNSINILMGLIYAYNETFGIDRENLEEKYYEILGSLGTIIGHEITHSLDASGSQYDEIGNYVNWWTDEDKNEYNKRNAKVVKYYNEFNQFGKTTLGENTADLGGMAIVLDIAKAKNASDDDYKTIFKSYASGVYCSQSTPFIKMYMLYYDEHSPDKNRVNAVLSTLDKFYEIFDIEEDDKMYIDKENRVSIW